MASFNNIGTKIPARLASDNEFPYIGDSDVQGGFRSCLTIAERDAIMPSKRKENMLCSVKEDGNTYELRGGILNSNWQIYNAFDNVKGDPLLNPNLAAILNSKLNAGNAINAYTPLGFFNAFSGIATNIGGGTTTLTATPDVSVANGAGYYIGASGNIGFAGLNFASGSAVNFGDLLVKFGTQWGIVRTSNTLDTTKGLLSHDDSIVIDKNLANAIKYIYLELDPAYAGNSIAVRILGYVAGTGFILQLYNVTTSTFLPNIVLGLETAKPSGIKPHTAHVVNQVYAEMIIDWNAFVGSFIQSSAYTVLVVTYPYSNTRTAINQFSNGIISVSQNNIDRIIQFAIKSLVLELKPTYAGKQIAIRIIGFVSSALKVQLWDVTSSTFSYDIVLSSDTAKPTGRKTYIAKKANEYNLYLDIDWSLISGSYMQSTGYTCQVAFTNLDPNRNAINQFSNGIVPFENTGDNDSLIKLAIQNIYYENVDNTASYVVTQLGFNGTELTVQIKNLTTLATFKYVLSADTAKPSGIGNYTKHNTNESYLKLTVNWEILPVSQISSSALLVKVLTEAYNDNRANSLSTVDTYREETKFNFPTKYINGVLDFSKIRLEIGSIASGVDSFNVNRIRTKFVLTTLGGSTLSYETNTSVAGTTYTMVVQQVLVSGTKQYSLINNGDSGNLTGTGSLVLNTRTEFIRIYFKKQVAGVEVKLSQEEINSANFKITTNYGVSDYVKSSPKFVENDNLFNEFIQEMYIDGLPKKVPYKIHFVRRQPLGYYSIQIYNATTNTLVYNWGTNTMADFNENVLFDRKVGNVSVKAVLNWEKLPVNYNTAGLLVMLTNKVFNLNYSPRLSAYYSTLKVRGNNLLQSIEKISVNNSDALKRIRKEEIPSLMNSINAEQVKAATIVNYDPVPKDVNGNDLYQKNGSIAVQVNGKAFDVCQERDTTIYDETCVLNVREIDLATKSMLSKTTIIGFDNAVLGEKLAKIPYSFAGILIGNEIRIYIRVKLVSSGIKFGYINFNITDKTFTSFTELSFINPVSDTPPLIPFSYVNYYNYLRDNIDSPFITEKNATSVDLTLGKGVMKFGDIYYALLSASVGMQPYNGTYPSIIKSTDGINWSILYTFNERCTQDDGTMFIDQNGKLYAQLRQAWGSNLSVISVFDLVTGKEVTSKSITTGTCRGEFFEYNANLYLLINADENRQYADLYKVSLANSYLSLTNVLQVEGWISNWSIHTFNSIVYVLFGTQIWQFKIDQYDKGVTTKLFNFINSL